MALGEEQVLSPRLRELLGISPGDAGVMASMIRRGINTPWTSSVGRLFDAVAALVIGAHSVSYEGEAAAWLEAVADSDETGGYPLGFHQPSPPAPLPGGKRGDGTVGDALVPRTDWRPMLKPDLRGLTTTDV
ncbi:MAG: hypothetical protein HY000_10450 [Planctomycetes bacterium]|nr:hypothetical protein [Planctomycetota bacterium]